MATLGRNYSGPSLDPVEAMTVALPPAVHANLDKTKHIRVSEMDSHSHSLLAHLA
jgi:hypothetical protein